MSVLGDVTRACFVARSPPEHARGGERGREGGVHVHQGKDAKSLEPLYLRLHLLRGYGLGFRIYKMGSTACR